MKVIIFGADGYIGYPLLMYLKSKGHRVYGYDNYFRRLHATSLTPVGDISRVDYGDVCDSGFVERIIQRINPDVIYNLAHIPSAPYSMKSVFHSNTTQFVNTVGLTNILWAINKHCPDTHVITIGTLGEYGYEDGEKRETDSFVPDPGSFYHASKVFATINAKLASKIWDLNVTDIMQGIVIGARGLDGTITRLDYDEEFGTVVNRFIVQAISGHSLTVYGTGNQIRAFLPLQDSIACLELLMDRGDGYRIINQAAWERSINSIANEVQKIAGEYGIEVDIVHIANPRVENENQRYYKVRTDTLEELGYIRTDLSRAIRDTFHIALGYKENVIKNVILPKVKWR